MEEPKADKSISERCDSCQRDNTDSSATVFCIQCSERLCDHCNKSHRINKASSSHKTQSISDVKDVEALSRLKQLIQCPDHRAKNIKYLCKDHDQLCCNECAIVKHRKCEYVVSLTEEIERATKNDSQTTENVLAELAKHAEKLLQYEEAEKVKVESTKNVCTEALATLKKNLEEAFKVIEEKTTAEAKRKRDEITLKIDGKKVEIAEYIIDVNETIQKLANVKRVGQDVHIYLTERKLRDQVGRFKEKIKVFRRNANDKDLTIHETSSVVALQTSLKKLIDVHVATVNPVLPDCSSEVMCRALPVKSKEFPLQLYQQKGMRKKRYSTTRACVNECLWLGNALVVVRDKTDIILIKTTGEGKPELIETCLQYDEPQHITKVDDRTIAIANNRTITLMNLGTAQKQLMRNRQFSIWTTIKGMAYDSSIQALVVLTNLETVVFVDLEGKNVETFSLHNIRNFSTSFENRIRFTLFDSSSKLLYVADDSTMIATSMESSTMFKTSLSKSLVMSPALDTDGNVYLPAHSEEGSVIQQINRKGIVTRTIEVSERALEYIMVCFNTQMNKMIVLCDDNGKEIKVFDVL